MPGAVTGLALATADFAFAILVPNCGLDGDC